MLHPILGEAAEFAGGIRILNQEKFETLISFIISANNNIPRIKGIIDRLCSSLGEPIDGGDFSFPDAEKIASAGIEALAPLRAGFRAKYIIDAAEKVSSGEVDLQKIDLIFEDLYNTKQNIVLVGMPGCGKTTVGGLLAEKLNFQFIDTDDLIVKKHGAITDIFENKGEKVFRDYESVVINEVSAFQGKVIATGGGAILRQENITSLKQNGKIYFLDRSLNNICATCDRPLSSNREDLEKRFKERYEIYCNCADCYILDIGTAEGNANTILEDILK